MNYTKNTLQKIEELFEELGYLVRYEKGSFQSGYAIVETKKIAVVNKFFETEARINALLEIFDQIEALRNAQNTVAEMGSEATEKPKNWQVELSEKAQKLIKQIRSHRNHVENETDNQ